MRAWLPPRFALPLVVALATTSARGDEGRFQDYAPGARAATLGGAYGALSDDATGIFFNPAGLVDVKTARVNVSTSLFGLELVGASPVQSDLLRRGVTAADLIFVPSSTGYVQGVGEPLPSGAYRDAVAFGSLVPEYTSRLIEQVPADELGTRFRSALTDRRLHAGAAWAHRVGPWLRLGVAGHYVLRTLDAEESLVSGDLGVPGAFIDATTRLRASSQAVRASLGAKLWLGPRATVGVVVTAPGLSLWRDVSFERVVAFSPGPVGEPRFSVDRVSTSGFELQNDLPGSGRVAFAFNEPGSFTFAIDVMGFLPVRYDVLRQDLLGEVELARVPLPLRVSKGPVANVAVGIDTQLSDDLSFAVGLFTNFSGAPALITNPDGSLAPESSRISQVHMIGGALSLGFHGRFSVTRVGVTGSTGFGHIVQAAAPDVRVLDDGPPLVAVEANQSFIYLFWSSTFRFGEEGSGRDNSL